jgi:hypothetical protein
LNIPYHANKEGAVCALSFIALKERKKERKKGLGFTDK